MKIVWNMKATIMRIIFVAFSSVVNTKKESNNLKSE